jgi:hypothetical protein
MGWPESVTYLLLVVLGYALTRIVDLAVDWQRNRLRLARQAEAQPGGAGGQHLSGTARQRLLERRAVYARFRKSVNDAVEACVNQGQGNYGMLYQIRDDYGDLLRSAPTGISQAADSVIRCVTLLVNLGPSDQRFAMFTRALKLFDEECEFDQGIRPVPQGPSRQEFAVLNGTTDASMGVTLPQVPAPGAGPAKAQAAPRTESDSASVHARM